MSVEIGALTSSDDNPPDGVFFSAGIDGADVVVEDNDDILASCSL